MLRILGIGDADSIHTIKWANYFAVRGHALHLVSFNPVSPASAAAYHPNVTLDPWLIPTFHLKRFWLTLSALRRIRATARHHRAQVVHAHYLGHAAWLAALAGVRPLVVSVMGGGDILGNVWRPNSLRERFLTPFTLHRSDLVLCWSPNLASIVKRMLGAENKVLVVVGGVDLHVFRRREEARRLRESLGISPDDFVIFSPRMLRPLSNIDVIVDALALVRRDIPKARLLLVMYNASSYADYASLIRHRVEHAGLEQAVHFLESIPNPEMPTHYSAVDCTVSIPSSDGTPMTVMESLACGTPVVVLDLPDYDPSLFVHRRTVLRIEKAQPGPLAEALVALACDRQLAQGMVRQARELVAQRVSYEVEMERIAEDYERLAATSR